MTRTRSAIKQSVLDFDKQMPIFRESQDKVDKHYMAAAHHEAAARHHYEAARLQLAGFSDLAFQNSLAAEGHLFLAGEFI
jgi:hypothetical protein